MAGKALVLDANILVRAVLGKRVREIIETSPHPHPSLYRRRRSWKQRSTARIRVFLRE
jgi:hypothetical protein